MVLRLFNVYAGWEGAVHPVAHVCCYYGIMVFLRMTPTTIERDDFQQIIDGARAIGFANRYFENVLMTVVPVDPREGIDVVELLTHAAAVGTHMEWLLTQMVWNIGDFIDEHVVEVCENGATAIPVMDQRRSQAGGEIVLSSRDPRERKQRIFQHIVGMRKISPTQQFFSSVMLLGGGGYECLFGLHCCNERAHACKIIVSLIVSLIVLGKLEDTQNGIDTRTIEAPGCCNAKGLSYNG